MKKRLILILLGSLLLAAAIGGTWWWRQAGARQTEVATFLPAKPALDAVSQAMREHINQADARARSRWHAKEGLAELSRLYHANGFLDEASRCYSGLQQMDPAEPRWFHLQASIIAGYGDIEPALVLWRRVLELAPDYLPARLRYGDGQLKTNHREEAAAAYGEVLKREHDNPYALLGLARLDMDAKQWDRARSRLEQVVTQTNYNLGYDLIVHLYEQIGLNQRAAAIRAMNKASGAFRDPADPWLDGLIDDCYDPFRLSLAAGFAFGLRDPAKAVQLLERAIALAPEDVSCHFQLGCMSMAQRNFTVAAEQLKLCTTLAPEFSDGWAQLSELQARTGDTASAENTLAIGLQHCPNSPGLHLMRARNLRKAGRNEEAINDFLISIRLRPNEPEALVELGSLYIDADRINEGIQKLHEALDADPGDPTAMGILAFYAISTTNEPEARRWLERVVIQPRVPREQVTRLLDAYRQAFGRDWSPDHPNE